MEGLEGKKDQEDCLGFQQKRGTSRIDWPRRKERPRGLPRGPGDKKDQQDGGEYEDGGSQNERGIKRIAKGTSIKEGAGGWRRPEGEREHADCQEYQQKRGTMSMEGARRREGSSGLPRIPTEKRNNEYGGCQKERGSKRIAKSTSRKRNQESGGDQQDGEPEVDRDHEDFQEYQ
jgi:hypothetical protein